MLSSLGGFHRLNNIYRCTHAIPALPCLSVGLVVSRDLLPVTDGVGGHDCRKERSRQQLNGVDVFALKFDIVAVPVGGVQIDLTSRTAKRSGKGAR